MLHARSERRQRLRFRRRNRAYLGLRCGPLRVPSMAQEPTETQTRQSGDFGDELRRILAVWIDAAPMKAHVDLDEDVYLPSGGVHRSGPSSRDIEVIDDERQVSAIEQREHSIGVDRVDWIGDPNVGDTGVREHLRFTDLRAADAHRPTFNLPPCQLGAFVRLRMRPQPSSAAVGERLHAFDVAGESRFVDKDGWGSEVGDFHGVLIQEKGGEGVNKRTGEGENTWLRYRRGRRDAEDAER